MLITNRTKEDRVDQYIDFVTRCACAGVTSVQIREKNSTYSEAVSFSLQLMESLKPFSVPVLVNDSIKIAKAINADGVHLGQTDGDIALARDILGKKKIIGASVDSISSLSLVTGLSVDYVGAGPIFKTKNKPDAKNIVGLRNLKKICEISPFPVIAIGGINESNIDAVIATGVSGIASIEAFHRSCSSIISWNKNSKASEHT
ncbi:thiamine phosphate synthase [Candidatus Hydrogenosomobacter endosymbioticus]|uniref:Thiamine-phosphate synthase n=1 Tax=Candidatus Hydrogenosomobacter endosymbioticus TaxID=2558174 RepID=A0ABM7V8Z3_9PROT|nr:thiamine phosphate synthase [Candidatus Hydrogenosomobacter endosymbioticus]BDB96268.1 thiamine-phosphate synthase [Candidatus Hydrogenosomobacter endosymbioticus]